MYEPKGEKLETADVENDVAQCADWRSLVVGINSVLTALAGLIGAYAVAKIREVKARVRDMQHKVGADRRDEDQ